MSSARHLQHGALRRTHRGAGLLIAALVTAVLVLSACSGQQAGSAATMGDARISEAQLTAQVQEILGAQGKPLDSADDALTTQTLSRMIVVYLVDTLATQQGVEVSQGRIDEQLAAYTADAGDEAAMQDTFVQQGVAPSQIDAFVRLNIQAQDLGVKIDPHGTAEEQGQALFEAVTSLSNELGVEASPRFGTWDATTLQLGPVPDDLSMLPGSPSPSPLTQ